MYLLPLEPSSASPRPSSHHRAPSWAPCAIQLLLTSCVFCTRWCVYVNATVSLCPILSCSPPPQPSPSNLLVHRPMFVIFWTCWAAIRTFHWLPITYQIMFKLFGLVLKAHSNVTLKSFPTCITIFIISPDPLSFCMSCIFQASSPLPTELTACFSQSSPHSILSHASWMHLPPLCPHRTLAVFLTLTLSCLLFYYRIFEQHFADTKYFHKHGYYLPGRILFIFCRWLRLWEFK